MYHRTFGCLVYLVCHHFSVVNVIGLELLGVYTNTMLAINHGTTNTILSLEECSLLDHGALTELTAHLKEYGLKLRIN